MILLVAVPVAAMTGGSALFEITQRTSDEERSQVLGRADLRANLSSAQTWPEVPDVVQREWMGLGSCGLQVAGKRYEARKFIVRSAALEANGLAFGMLTLQKGSLPTAAGDVAVSPRVLHELAISIGGNVLVDNVPHRVTGTVVDPEKLDIPIVLCTGDSAASSFQSVLFASSDKNNIAAVEKILRLGGVHVIARNELGVPDPFESLVIFVVGGFGFFESAIVIAAAFAVSLRRRQRELGLLGASGATVVDLRASLTLSALVLAAFGTALGVLVGLGAAVSLHPFLDGWNQRLNGPFEISIIHTAGAVVLGLATATLAALIPAIYATRLPIRVALSGRRPAPGGTKIWVVLGLLFVTAGFGCVLAGTQATGASAAAGILGGSILGVLGLGACTPFLLSALSHYSASLPLQLRLAVRDAGRFQTRNGAAVMAILAGMSVSVMLSALSLSVDRLIDARPAPILDGQLLVESQAAPPAVHLVHVILAVCFVTGLVVVFIATTLSSVESASDTRVLYTVGAAPSTLRAHAASRAGYLALLGCVLSIPAGLIPSYGLLSFGNIPLEFGIPWTEIAIIIIGFPSAAFLGVWFFTLLRPPNLDTGSKTT
ncbi:MAG: FtsX-like permease family protein [Planctomycetota bacterium]